MLLELTDATVTLGGNTVLNHISMEIRQRDKIALVGANGAGKTTLLKLLMGEITADADDKRQGAAMKSSRRITKGMLRQVNGFDAGLTVEEYMLSVMPQTDPYSRERFEFEMEFDRLFTGLGFQKEEKKKYLKEFSGGEQTKIAFIELLLQKPDLLLLDEPTNHLDIATVEWLEEYMKHYPKAVVFVSHDRFFLDRVADLTYELQNGSLTHYSGNYSFYRIQKKKNAAILRKQYDAQQQEIARLDAVIEKFKHKPKKAAFARAKKSQLARMKPVPKPVEDTGHFFTEPIVPLYPGSKWVYEAEKLSVGYHGKAVIHDLSLRLRRGQKIAIIGANGVGKTTLLKTISGDLMPVKGKSTLGNHVLMGYFDQKSAEMLSEQTVYEHFKAQFPGLLDRDIRNMLAAYLFTGESVYKKVSDLSGGERARLYLMELLSSRPNLMLLDEPTNHMDIAAKETMESAFSAYQGSLLFVSHDRYFVAKVADAILLIEDNVAYYYPFGYEHYLAHAADKDTRDLSALVTAESQAMVAGLKAVPKPERHRLKEQNTELAYVEWRRSLAAEPIEEIWNELYNALMDGNDKLIEAKEKSLTDACLDWYDVYLETE